VQAFTVGGNLVGLAYGDSLTLQDNGSDVLVVSGNGPFKFAKPILTGSPYKVTVTNPTSPAVQTCVVTSGVGTMGTAPVNTVGVDCTTSTYTLSVTLTGLDSNDSFSTYSSGGGTVTFAVGSGGGTLTFPNPVASGTTYYGADGVATGPDYQYCYIPEITITNANATVTGSCGAVTYSVGGTVTGLAPGDTFTIENEGNQYVVNGNGAFTFSQRWSSGSPYDVIVITDPVYPVAQTCVVSSGGSGTVTNANITMVNVTCM
jgi:large repetitive protein